MQTTFGISNFSKKQNGIYKPSPKSIYSIAQNGYIEVTFPSLNSNFYSVNLTKLSTKICALKLATIFNIQLIATKKTPFSVFCNGKYRFYSIFSAQIIEIAVLLSSQTGCLPLRSKSRSKISGR